MFRKFDPSSDISGQTALKSSAQRALRQKLLESTRKQRKRVSETLDSTTETLDSTTGQENEITRQAEDQIEQLLPKKSAIVQLKCKDRISLFTLDSGKVLFFNSFDGDLHPHLRVIHQFPDYLPRVQVDKGAIKFILSGANIMAPGLTNSNGAWLPPADQALPKDTVVSIYAHGKQHACAIGQLVMSTEEIKSINKGVAIEVLHCLGDDLWKNPVIAK